MKDALEEALMGVQKNHGGPFGAVIVKDGKVVARAHNTVLRDSDSTCHAEMNAIRKASARLKTFDLDGCEVYTTGKPCPMCASAIQWAKIDKVYFGCDFDDAKDIGFDEESGNNNSYTEEQIEHESCKELYEKYKGMNRGRY